MHNARLANYSQASFYFKIVECTNPPQLGARDFAFSVEDGTYFIKIFLPVLVT